MIDIAYRWATEITPVSANHPGAGGFIIAVKDEIIIDIKFTVIFLEGFKNECLKKPGRVAEMPFRRTDVANGLYDIILFFQRAANILGAPANFFETI